MKNARLVLSSHSEILANSMLGTVAHLHREHGKHFRDTCAVEPLVTTFDAFLSVFAIRLNRR